MTPDDHAAFEKAQAYAWGRQDTGDDPYDSDRAREFARVYVQRAVEFLQDRASCLPNLRAAYEEWRLSGTITDGYHAPTRRRLPLPPEEGQRALARVAWEQSSGRTERGTPFSLLSEDTRRLWRRVALCVLRDYADQIDATLVLLDGGDVS